MSERKVLKEMLVKLKIKTINSQMLLVGTSLSMSSTMTESMKNALDEIMKMPDGEAKKSSLLLLAVFQSWNQNFNLLNVNIGNLVGDMNLYIETLERYSNELDNTFQSLIEQAKKEAEEQRKQNDPKQKGYSV